MEKFENYQYFSVEKKNMFIIIIFFYHIWAWQSMERDHLNKLSILFKR